MICLLILLSSLISYGQSLTTPRTKSCSICIIDSSCEDSTIHFNISISRHCVSPLNVYFTYVTDVNKKPRYFNTTANCTNCYTTIDLDAVRGAWDYILTVESPKSAKMCPTKYSARCGGKMSRWVWYVAGGLSGLLLVGGFVLYGISQCRSSTSPVKPKKKKQKKADVLAVNT